MTTDNKKTSTGRKVLIVITLIIVLVLFAALRERLVAADVPLTFKGSSIALITAGLMSLAFMGFTGLVK